MDLLRLIQQHRERDDFEDFSETDEWQELIEWRHAEMLSEMPVPFCCPMAAGARATFAADTDPPGWKVAYPVVGNGHSYTVAHACPFCGTRLPALVLKKNPPPQVCRTDGYYCEVCRERLLNCLCSHPLSIYEAENAPPDFAVAALVVSESPGLRLYLSVSRKNNPNDRGMPGGKIDPGETPREALVRELREETGLTAVEFHPVFDAQDSTDKRCLTYRVTKVTGEIATKETGVVGWVERAALTAPGSTFEAYNRALFHLVDPYDRYGC